MFSFFLYLILQFVLFIKVRPSSQSFPLFRDQSRSLYSIALPNCTKLVLSSLRDLLEAGTPLPTSSSLSFSEHQLSSNSLLTDLFCCKISSLVLVHELLLPLQLPQSVLFMIVRALFHALVFIFVSCSALQLLWFDYSHLHSFPQLFFFFRADFTCIYLLTLVRSPRIMSSVHSQSQ